MSPGQVAVVVILCTVMAALATGMAAYFRAINGKVPNAVAAGIEAGLASLKRGPLPIFNFAPSAGGGTQTLVAPSILEGGGPLSSTVKPWYPASYIPCWNQLAGPLPDGNMDPEIYSDCGETCVAMVVAGVHGVPLDPGGLRQFLHGPGGTGLTDGNELVHALAYCSTAAHVEKPSGEIAWNVLQTVVRSERPIIMLGRWASVGGSMHWQVAVKVEADRVWYCNPFNATRSYTLKDDWLAQYAGELVVLDSHIHYDCRTWPQPT